MLALPMVTGVLTLLAVLAGGGAIRALPVRWACPDCHHATSPVRRALIRPVAFLIQWRWCPRCHWSGWSRKRTVPVEEPQPLAPRTGFEWGDGKERPRRRRWVFRWKGEVEEQATPAEPEPVHPSGFQWADQQGKTTPPPPPVPHPSGFQWGGDESSEAPGFRWKSPEKAVPSPAELVASLLTRVATSPEHPSGFRWGDGVEESSVDESEFAWPGTGEPDTFGFRWAE